MSDHSFNPLIAKIYGVTEAIIISSFVFWTRTNYSKDTNFHENRFWCFGTAQFFMDYFPYLTLDQIKYSLRSMVKKGVLLKGNFNKKGYDKTNWYSLSDQTLIELNLDRTCLKSFTGLIAQNCTMDCVKSHDGSCKFTQPIPSTKPSTKPIKTTTTAKASPSSSFESQVLSLKIPTDTRSDKIFLDNIYHHIENNSKNLSNIYKKRSGIISILKNLNELNELFCSDGFIDQETKKKKELEAKKREQEFLDAQERQHEKRMDEYKRSKKNVSS